MNVYRIYSHIHIFIYIQCFCLWPYDACKTNDISITFCYVSVLNYTSECGEHQHVSIVGIFTFSSMLCRSLTELLYPCFHTCLSFLFLIFFPPSFHCPLRFPTLCQAWSSPGGRSHLRRWWQGLCSGTTGRQQTAALWRDTTWECTSLHTG